MKIGADTDGFNAGIDTAGQKMDSFSGTIKAGTKDMRNLKQALTGIVSTAGFAVAALLAVFNALKSIHDYIDNVWGDGKAHIDALVDSLGGINVANAAQHLGVLVKKVSELDSELSRLRQHQSESPYPSVLGRSEKTITEERDAAKKVLDETRLMIQGKRNLEAKAAREKAEREQRGRDIEEAEEEKKRQQAVRDADAEAQRLSEQEDLERRIHEAGEAYRESIRQEAEDQERITKAVESRANAMERINKSMSGGAFDANRLEVHFSRMSQLLERIAAQRGVGRGSVP